MADDQQPPAWLPFAIAEASVTGTPASAGLSPTDAFTHLLTRLAATADIVGSNPVVHNEADLASGLRHLLVLLAAGVDEALRFEPEPVLGVRRTSTDDVVTWGMECPDCLYTRATMRGGETYRVSGSRGTARYVGLQTMNGIATTANRLVDELEVAPDGTFEIVLCADEREGNWMPIEGTDPTLTVRHFFYDWDTEVPSVLHIERIGEQRLGEPARDPDPATAITRQLVALGDFVHDNLQFFLEFGGAPPVNGFLPPIDRTAMGAAAENKPVIGRWLLEPDEALILEVQPPEGLYWSFSLGNPWWETIHYGRHQSSLNGHQAVVDSDGLVRVVLCDRDPGIANWLDTGGFSGGAMILRCVRTETAPTPSVHLVPFGEIGSSLPADTRKVDAAERAETMARRRRAVHDRFVR